MNEVMSPEVVVALDIPEVTRALSLAKNLIEAGAMVKLGMVLHAAAAYAGRLDEVREVMQPEKLMLDLKPWDTHQTVERASRIHLEFFRPALFTVPVPFNHPSFAKVVKMAKSVSPGTVILGVTALTSLQPEEVNIASSGVFKSGEEAVDYYAALAVAKAGFGLVCSPEEVQMVCKKYPAITHRATPGVRPMGAQAKGQARFTTPAQAIKNGSTHPVVGSPVYEAPNPVMAYHAIAEETVKAWAYIT